ncbi:hypothetical protein BJX99DRAFT_62502 [Aspergillus californicus]
MVSGSCTGSTIDSNHTPQAGPGGEAHLQTIYQAGDQDCMQYNHSPCTGFTTDSNHTPQAWPKAQDNQGPVQNGPHDRKDDYTDTRIPYYQIVGFYNGLLDIQNRLCILWSHLADLTMPSGHVGIPYYQIMGFYNELLDIQNRLCILQIYLADHTMPSGHAGMQSNHIPLDGRILSPTCSNSSPPAPLDPLRTVSPNTSRPLLPRVASPAGPTQSLHEVGINAADDVSSSTIISDPSRTCLKCGKVFRHTSSRSRHEQNICKLEKRPSGRPILTDLSVTLYKCTQLQNNK